MQTVIFPQNQPHLYVSTLINRITCNIVISVSSFLQVFVAYYCYYFVVVVVVVVVIMVEEGKYGPSMAILQRYLTTDDNNGEGRVGGGEMRERELHILFLLMASQVTNTVFGVEGICNFVLQWVAFK